MLELKSGDDPLHKYVTEILHWKSHHESRVKLHTKKEI